MNSSLSVILKFQNRKFNWFSFQHLKTYLDAAKEGFIYVSFGSNVKSKDLEDHVLDVLLEVMGKLPFKILWKYEAEDLPKKPKNVMIVQWAPQQDILSKSSFNYVL